MKKTVYLVLALGVFGGCAGDVWCGYGRPNGRLYKSDTRGAFWTPPVKAPVQRQPGVNLTPHQNGYGRPNGVSYGAYVRPPAPVANLTQQQINALYDTAKAMENQYRATGAQKEKALTVRDAYKAVYEQIPGDTIDAKLQKANEELKEAAYIIWNSVFKVASYDNQIDLICRLFSTCVNDAQRKHLDTVVDKYFSKAVKSDSVSPFQNPTEAACTGVLAHSASFLGRQILNSDKHGTNKFQDALPFFEIQKNCDQGASALLGIATIKGLLDTTDDKMNSAVNEAVRRLMDLSQAAADGDQNSAHMLSTSLSSISAVSDFRMMLGDVCSEDNAFLSDAPNQDPESRYQAMMYHAVASLIERYGNRDKAKAVRAAHEGFIRAVGYIPGLCSLLLDNNGSDISALDKDETVIDATAMFLRGRIFQFGNNPDIGKAIKWYERAAKAEHQYAQYNLGWIYNNKDDATHRDIKQSIYWYAQVLQHQENPSLKQRAKKILYFLWNRILFKDGQYSYTEKVRTSEQFTFKDTADWLKSLEPNQIVEAVGGHYMINVGGAIHVWLQFLKDGNLSASERTDLISKLQYRLKFTTQHPQYSQAVEGQYRYRVNPGVYSAPFNLNEDQLQTLEGIGITPNGKGGFQYHNKTGILVPGGTAPGFDKGHARKRQTSAWLCRK